MTMKESDRLYLIDWLKVATLLAIQILHANEFVFFEDDFPIASQSVIWTAMSYYARFFSLGGQVLVAIIYLLFGLSGKSSPSLLKIAGFAIIGQFLLTLAFFDGNYLSQIEWDIYFFIAASNLILMLLPRSSWRLVALGFLALLIPPSFYKSIMPDGFIGNILTGRSEIAQEGAWPLFPWFFLSLLFFNLGALIRDGKLLLRQWNRTETFLWPILFGLTLPFLGHFYWTPIGPRYYEFNFHQLPHLFWTNFLPFVFIMRISFLNSVKERLARHKYSRIVGNLIWARQLGAAYIVAVLYVGFAGKFEEEFKQTPYLFDLFFISIMPVTELIVRMMMKIIPKKK
ncbi:MAG: hypothetical protein V4598_04770 [Bdellovibrionota bacterium]